MRKTSAKSNFLVENEMKMKGKCGEVILTRKE